MADTGIFTNNAEVKYKAGANASSTATAEAYTNEFIRQAESYINTLCRYNYSDNYSSLNDDVKMILKEAASNIAAIYCINYDMSGFTSRSEALIMINLLWARAMECIDLLKQKQYQDFINGA